MEGGNIEMANNAPNFEENEVSDYYNVILDAVEQSFRV
jgi:hypothetical protein